MSDYTVETLNGLLTQVQSCGELLEAVIPWAERLLTEFPILAPRLFFLTQDGEDGLLTFEPETIDRLGKDNLAYKLRRFCALQGVKACAILCTAKLRESPARDNEDSETPLQDRDGQSTGTKKAHEGDGPTIGERLLPVGTDIGWLAGEFLGDRARACIWRIDPSTGPVRLEKAWNVEATSTEGRFVNLLGQGSELGYPVSEELRERVVAHSQAHLERHPGMLSIEKGKTAGEIAFETDEGAGRLRLVEKHGVVYWIGLYSGKPMCKADKARLLAELRCQTGRA